MISGPASKGSGIHERRSGYLDKYAREYYGKLKMTNTLYDTLLSRYSNRREE